MVSFSVVSLIAIVPDSECSTPILIVPWVGVWAWAAVTATSPPRATAPASSAARQIPLTSFIASLFPFCAAWLRPLGAGAVEGSKIEANPATISGEWPLF